MSAIINFVKVTLSYSCPMVALCLIQFLSYFVIGRKYQNYTSLVFWQSKQSVAVSSLMDVHPCVLSKL